MRIVIGYDASNKVDRLAAERKASYKSVAMGSSEGYDLAERCITAAAKEGALQKR